MGEPNVRVLVLLIGTLVTTAGVVTAVRHPTGESTTAIVVAGAFLILLGVLGHRITSFKLRDAEIVFAIVEESAEARNAGEDDKADALVDAAQRRAVRAEHGAGFWERAPSVVSAVEYERKVLAALPYSYEANVVAGDLARFDAVVTAPEGKVIVDVRPRFTSSSRLLFFLRSIALLSKSNELPGDALMIVYLEGQWSAANALRREAERAGIPAVAVRWDPDSDSPDILKRQVDDLLRSRTGK